jgi:hypothetical protein
MSGWVGVLLVIVAFGLLLILFITKLALEEVVVVGVGLNEVVIEIVFATERPGAELADVPLSPKVARKFLARSDEDGVNLTL